MSNLLFVFGTSSLERHVNGLVNKLMGIKEVSKIDWRAHNNKLSFSIGNDSFIIEGVFAVNAVNLRNEIKWADKVFFFGMCFGYSDNINVGDYCLPEFFDFANVSHGEYSIINQFKKDDLAREVKIKNIFYGLIKKKSVHYGIRNFTAYGIITKHNAKLLKFDTGEMEAYHVAESCSKYHKPFGCLMICTDNKESTIIDYLIVETKEILHFVSDKKFSASELSDLREIESLMNYRLTEDSKEFDKFFKLYDKIKSFNLIKKFRDNNKEKEVNIFASKTVELINVLIELINNRKLFFE